jgi:protocatechuate 3,4-dioxygenase beta subunit
VLGSIQSRVRAFAVTAVIASLLAAPGAPAYAEDTASISGTIVAADTGSPVDQGCVTAWDADTDSWVANACTWDGTYSITDLPAGSYKLEFDDYSGSYLHQWYDGRADFADADVVDVAEGAAVTGIDFTVHPAAWIHGTITDRATGDPVQGVCASAVGVDGDSAPGAADPCTNEAGEYALRGLPVGDYKVRFTTYGTPYLEQWAVSKPDEESADVIHAALEGTELNDQMTRGAVISGTVTDAGTGAPLSQVCGVALASPDSEFSAGDGCTDEDGRYAMSAVQPGTYYLKFDDDTGAHTPYRSGPVDVPGDITYDVAMKAGASITGIIRDARTGVVVPDVCTELYDAASGEQVFTGGSDCTGIAGRYSLRGVPPGHYKLLFSTDSESEYVEGWYAASNNGPAVVTITEGEALTIDGTVRKGGVISGRVRDAKTGEPLARICATTGYYSPRAGEVVDTDRQPSCTGADGTYALKGLKTGRYKVQFFDASDDHAWQFYPDKPDRDTAQWVSVRVERVTAGIDGSLPEAGSVSGTITDAATGEPIGQVCVDTVSARTGHPIGMTTCSDADGHYSARGLPTTSVKLFFMHDTESPQYAEQWAFGKPDKASADPVATTAGTDVSGADIRMVAAP